MKRLLAALLLTGGQAVGAATVIVPDESLSIQAAVDGGADTVLVRPGSYPEALVLAEGVVLRRLVPDGSDEQPEVDGLRHSPTSGSPTGRPVFAEGFAFRGRVMVEGFSQPRTVELVACRLDSGITSTGWIAGPLRLRRCVLAGSTRVITNSDAIVDSNSVQGPLVIDADAGLFMRGNSATGSDSAGIVGYASGTIEFMGNRFLEPNRGISLRASSGDIRLEDNLVRHSSGPAIQAYAGYSILASRNVVEASHSGINLGGDDLILARRNRISGTTSHGLIVSSSGRASADSNIVLRCGGNGIAVYGNVGSAIGNVVGRCGGSGIAMGSMSFSAEHNTSYLNAGHGISAPGGIVAWNIGYRNGGAGLEIGRGGTTESACNNWFENAAGPVAGRPVTAADLELDPMFCDVGNDDVRLDRRSPLLATVQCGAIGALGIGCGPAPTTELLHFSATPLPAGVEIRWRVTHAGTDFADWLERADQANGPWTRVAGARSVEGDDLVELDRDVRPGRTYRYRFVTVERGVFRVLGPPIEVTAATQSRSGLVRVGPNPVSGPLLVEFAVVEPAEIALEVFDLQGRRLETLARGEWPAGHHHVQWSGIYSGGPAAAGVFTLRFRHAGGVEERRIVRLQ